MPPRLLTLLAIALPLAACLPTTSEPAKTSPRTPPYRQNPNPKHAYRITLQIKDAPGPFAAIQAHAQYQIIEQTCLPPMDRFTGAQHMSNSASRKMALTQLSENNYSATAYIDGMEDADYFGRGKCHWKLILTGFELRAAGSSGETKFIPMIWEKAITEQRSETLYFWKGGYPRSGVDDFPDFGFESPNRYKPELRDELFTMTITSKEVTR